VSWKDALAGRKKSARSFSHLATLSRRIEAGNGDRDGFADLYDRFLKQRLGHGGKRNFVQLAALFGPRRLRDLVHVRPGQRHGAWVEGGRIGAFRAAAHRDCYLHLCDGMRRAVVVHRTHDTGPGKNRPRHHSGGPFGVRLGERHVGCCFREVGRRLL